MLEIEEKIDDYDRENIDNFDFLEKDYEDFYNTDVNTIKIYYIYVNSNNEIYNIKCDNEILDNSCLTKERILYLVKNYQYNLNNKHKLISLLKFNIHVKHTEIKNFLYDKLDDHFLTSLKIVDDINFSETITILNDLNSVFFIFSNNPRYINNTTKKINITSSKSNYKTSSKTTSKTTSKTRRRNYN